MQEISRTRNAKDNAIGWLMVGYWLVIGLVIGLVFGWLVVIGCKKYCTLDS